MKSKITTVILTVILTFTISKITVAQIPDDTNGRLWRLCKVWGFAKYYHQNNCDVKWNNLLLTAIDSVIAATSNESFNAALMNLLDSAGITIHATDSLIINADVNKNAYFDWINDTDYSQQVRDNLDSILVNFRPTDICFLKINNYVDPNYNSWIDFRGDSILNIPNFSYSIESNRLFVFFYYWNTINYFQADKDLMDQSWDSTLHQFIPVFRAATNDTEFEWHFRNLATYLNDSHAFTSSPIIDNLLGVYYPELKVSYIEGKTVVTNSLSQGISIGDVIEKINGIDAATLLDSLMNYESGSNDSYKITEVHDYDFLSGPPNSTIVLDLLDSTGASYETSVTRSLYYSDYYNWAFADPNPVYMTTDCGYGYVDMGKLQVAQIPGMWNALKNAPAIIFDQRNYPNGTLWSLLPKLLSGPKTWALLTMPYIQFPGWYDWYDNKYDAGHFINSTPYTGKVIILCNSETLSQAEYTVMGLQQCANPITIGSQTGGADGNVSYLSLPGGITTYWTSLGIYYPDTISAQRVGVHIDSIVTPTIVGVRHRKDEVLEAALSCITGIKNLSREPNFNIYPNPASDLVVVSANFSAETNLEIQVMNMIGEKIFQREIPKNAADFTMDVSSWKAGVYIASLHNDNGMLQSCKIIVYH